MDATSLYPDGFHPIYAGSLPEQITRSATLLSRNDVSVTYYYVDFGISTWLKPEDTDRLVLGSDGLDQDVPELSDDVPYDPFKVDIFVLGNFFRENFTQVSTTFRREGAVNQSFQKYSNVGILEPLVSQMTRRNPARRPTAANVLQQWKALRRSVWSVQRFWRPRPREEGLVVRAFSDVFSLVGVSTFVHTSRGVDS